MLNDRCLKFYINDKYVERIVLHFYFAHIKELSNLLSIKESQIEIKIIVKSENLRRRCQLPARNTAIPN